MQHVHGRWVGCLLAGAVLSYVSTSAAIIGGEVSGAEGDAVVLIRVTIADGVAVCTGALVAPNLVLTAGHCASSERLDGSTEPFDPSLLTVFTGTDAPTKAAEKKEPAARGREIHVPPSRPWRDVAFLVLDRHLDQKTLAISSTLPDVGDPVTLTGYGVDETGDASKQRRTRTVPVRYRDEFSFELPKAICGGDSGGPALSTAGSIVGVVSMGSVRPTCEENPSDAATIATLRGLDDLVETAFRSAGAMPPPRSAEPSTRGDEGCGVALLGNDVGAAWLTVLVAGVLGSRRRSRARVRSAHE